MHLTLEVEEGAHHWAAVCVPTYYHVALGQQKPLVDCQIGAKAFPACFALHLSELEMWHLAWQVEALVAQLSCPCLNDFYFVVDIAVVAVDVVGIVSMDTQIYPFASLSSYPTTVSDLVLDPCY